VLTDSAGNNVLSESGGVVTLTADEANVGSNALVVNASGNVGIGTSSPSSRLEVAGAASPTVTMKSTSGPYSEINSNTVGSLSLLADRGDTGASTNCSIYVDGNLEFRVTPGYISFNSGYGSVATAYGCRAWVNFDGTTNTAGFCTIRGSGNVSSVTDNGTAGDYTVNFATAMPDGNYGFSLSSTFGTTRESVRQVYQYSTTSMRVLTGFSYTAPGSQDSASVSIAIFR
jgi:hypothetical protein